MDAHGAHTEATSGAFFTEPDEVLAGCATGFEGGWNGQKLFDGDFRGDLSEKTMSTKMLAGDFYGGVEDCTRNVSAEMLTGGDGSNFYPFSKGCYVDGKGYAGSGTQSESMSGWFEETNKPPSMPVDCWYTLEATNIDVPTEVPHVLGNNLLDFFATRIVGVAPKINKKKFCFKANVLIRNNMCTVKVRIYYRRHGLYVVEFQKRSGDSISFSSLFSDIVRFLQKYHDIAVNLYDDLQAAALPLDQDMTTTEVPAGAVQPLLDMAVSSAPELQTESAEALAGLAQDEDGAACLLNAGTLSSALKVLLRTKMVQVALPTIQVLASTKDVPEAAGCLSDGELLQLVRDWANFPDLNTPAQKQLKSVLKASENLPRCDGWGRAEDVTRDLTRP